MFCMEYLKDLNGTQAAIRAGYSEKTAGVIANENLTKPYLQKRIQELKKERMERIEITADYLVQTLKKWLESDITETLLLDAEGLKQLPREIRQLITKVKVTTTKIGGSDLDGESGVIKEVIELSFVSKERAADMLAKHIGFYERDNDQKKSNINFVIPSEKVTIESDVIE